MGKFGFVPDIKLLVPDEWLRLRDIRLSALRESPDAFLSTYEQEQDYSERQWRAEFARGDWNVGLIEGRPVSLLGVTRESSTPEQECYLEYLWVSPECRRSGVARTMLTAIIERLRTSGMTTVFLWVLDGNEPAKRLYEHCGFTSTGLTQRPRRSPLRSEELMRLIFRERSHLTILNGGGY